MHDHKAGPAHGHGGGHDHAPDRGGHSGHGHSHAPASFGRAFAIGTALNLGFVVVEVIYGLAAGSVALLADAGHNMSDVLGLLIAWGAATLAKRRPSGRYTYGLRSSSILAAFLNALLLLVATGIIAFEAVRRLSDHAPVAGKTGLVTVLRRSLESLELVQGDRRDDQTHRRVQAGGGSYCADQRVAA